MNLGALQDLLRNLGALGAERLFALAMAAVLIGGMVLAGSYLASKSGFETLYVGLTPQDSSRMGATLADAGIAFETSADSSKISVPIGEAAQARALLAEKGLPGSPNAGYELFDNLGALGLTSFMQEITRVRALEGELARTIQQLKSVRSARVHLVLPQANSFRANKQTPSASVVVSTNGTVDPAAAGAIRHVVAAAIPEMRPDQVNIVGTDGRMLASSGTAAGEATTRTIDLEKRFAEQIEDNVRRTLTPYFGPGNFEISALARLNTDKRQSTETAYDPDQRVERSVRVIKEAEKSQAATGNSAVSVEQNIPNEGANSSGAEQSKRAQDRKEETTNYEVGSKSATTTSEGYRIENISLAIVLNRKRIGDILGKQPSDQEVNAEIAEVEKLVRSAAGVDAKRGDLVTVSAVNFAAELLPDAGEASGWLGAMISLIAVAIKSLTIIAVATIVVWAGFRPLTRTLLMNSSQAALEAPGTADERGENVALGSTSGSAALPLDRSQADSRRIEMRTDRFDGTPGSSNFGGADTSGPVERLASILDQDEEHAAAVLKHWVRSG